MMLRQVIGHHNGLSIAAVLRLRTRNITALRCFGNTLCLRQDEGVANIDKEDSSELSNKAKRRAIWREGRERELERWREKRDSDPELVARWTFRKDLRVLGQTGEWEAVLARLDGARVSGFPPMDIGVFQRGILALSQCNRYEEAKELLLQMKGRGFQPTRTIYNAVIAAASRAGDWARASQEFRTMRNWGVGPNLNSYNLVIRAMARAGHWHKALTMSDEMQKRKIKPDQAHFNYLMYGLGVSGRWRRAQKMFKDMQRRGYVLGKKEHNTLLFALGRNLEGTRAAALLEEMKEAGLEPDVFSYLSAATSMDINGDSAKAKQILSEMAEKGMDPSELSSVVSYRKLELLDLALIRMVPHAYGILGRHEEMVAFFNKMADEGPYPDAHAYQLALDIAKKSENSDNIIALVRESMKRNSVEPIPFEKYS